MNSGQHCDYCDTDELVYEMSPMRGGTVYRCLECLAIEQGQQKLDTPFEKFIDNENHEENPIFEDAEHWNEHRRRSYEGARSWFKVLARIKNDDPLVKRDEDAIGTLPEERREMLIHLMGSAAYYSPSEIIESNGDPEQATLTTDDQ